MQTKGKWNILEIERQSFYSFRLGVRRSWPNECQMCSLDRIFGKRLLPSDFISMKQVENWRGSKIPLSYNFNGNWAAAGWSILHFTEIALWSCMSLGNCKDIIVGLRSTCCCWLSSLRQGISWWWWWQDHACFQWDAHCWGFIQVS